MRAWTAMAAMRRRRRWLGVRMGERDCISTGESGLGSCVAAIATSGPARVMMQHQPRPPPAPSVPPPPLPSPDGAGPSNQFARRGALRAPSGDEESEEEGFDVETERWVRLSPSAAARECHAVVLIAAMCAARRPRPAPAHLPPFRVTPAPSAAPPLALPHFVPGCYRSSPAACARHSTAPRAWASPST